MNRLLGPVHRKVGGNTVSLDSKNSYTYGTKCMPVEQNSADEKTENKIVEEAKYTVCDL